MTNICFYGTGSIVESIIRGLLQQQIVDPAAITAINRSNSERLQRLAVAYGIQAIHEGHGELQKQDVLRKADVIVLAMKPKDAAAAILSIREFVHANQLIISVIAGLSIETMFKLFGHAPIPIVRTMPNTSSSIGLGMTGISYANHVTETQQSFTQQIFQSIGETAVLAEEQLDILTGISGSGPAYVYYMMEAMTHAGVLGGLNEDIARKLTLQTFLGATQMVKETHEHPLELRRKVTSPNGTTQAAIETLDQHHFHDGIVRAIHRAAARAGEIGRSLAEEANGRNK